MQRYAYDNNHDYNYYFFLYQNVRITEAWTALTERLRTLQAAIIVTMESDLVGFVLRGPPLQECQLHVHLETDVTQVHPAGWMVDTPQ